MCERPLAYLVFDSSITRQEDRLRKPSSGGSSSTDMIKHDGWQDIGAKLVIDWACLQRNGYYLLLRSLWNKKWYGEASKLGSQMLCKEVVRGLVRLVKLEVGVSLQGT